MPLCPGAAAADRSTGVAAAAVHVVGLGLRRPPRCRSPSPGRSRSWATGLWTAVDVFRRIILEAEKIDGAASQGKSSCSVM
uniref:Ras-like protein, mTORC1 binding n=1 Tax=Myotis myotis TaxID=51298 RepID=A0A7J7RLQ7_MYOMY|nr:Ras-like protein, mTORC1 binding [Myotis myotis]